MWQIRGPRSTLRNTENHLVTILQLKESAILGEMADSRAGTRKVKDESETSWATKSSRKDGKISKRYKRQFKGAPTG